LIAQADLILVFQRKFLALALDHIDSSRTTGRGLYQIKVETFWRINKHSLFEFSLGKCIVICHLSCRQPLLQY